MPMQATTTTPLFSAALRPDRSLRAVGGWIGLGLAALVAVPLAVVAPAFVVPMGTGFALAAGGLVVLGLRQARRQRLSQHLTVWPEQIEIATTDSHGTRTLQRFDPAAVRLVLDRDENESTRSVRLEAGQDSVEIGAFLSTEDKSSLAKAFGTALRKARRETARG